MSDNSHVFDDDKSARDQFYRLAQMTQHIASESPSPDRKAQYHQASAGYAQAAGMFAIADAIKALTTKQYSNGGDDA